MEDNTERSPNYKGVALAAWIMIVVICLIALIPAVGLLTWFIAFPVLVATFVLGIIAITRGGTLQGVLILLVSVIAAPVFLLIAPMASTFIFAVALGEVSENVAGKADRLGEHQTERGLIYYFSDGVIAVDTTITPNRFHIFAKHPGGREIRAAQLIVDGVEITRPGINEVAKEVAVGFSGGDVPGKVHVIIEELDQDGELFTQARHIAIDPESIQQLIDKADWNASVRKLWEKDKSQGKLSNGTSPGAEESSESPE